MISIILSVMLLGIAAFVARRVHQGLREDMAEKTLKPNLSGIAGGAYMLGVLHVSIAVNLVWFVSCLI